MNVVKITFVVLMLVVVTVIAGCQGTCGSMAAQGPTEKAVHFRPTGTGFYGPDVISGHYAE
jgi:hypothetical protein